MPDMTGTSRPLDLRGRLLIAAFTAALAAALVAVWRAVAPVLLWQVAAFSLGVAVLWLLLRYRLTVFVYEIEQRDGAPYLCVYARQGRRYTPQCRLELSALLAVRHVQKGQKTPKPPRLHRYTTQLFSTPHTRLTFRDGAGTLTVDLDLTEEMAAALAACVERSRDAADPSDAAPPEADPPPAGS